MEEKVLPSNREVKKSKPPEKRIMTTDSAQKCCPHCGSLNSATYSRCNGCGKAL